MRETLQRFGSAVTDTIDRGAISGDLLLAGGEEFFGDKILELAPPKVKHGHNTGKVFNRELKETVKAVLSFLREEDNFAAEFLEKGAPPALYYWYRLALGSEGEKDLVRFLAYRPLPGLVPLVGKTGEIPAG